MAYLLGQRGFAPRYGQAELVGWPANVHGFGEPTGQAELVGWPARMHGLGEPSPPSDVVGGFAFDRADLGPPQYTRIIALARRIMAGAVSVVRLVGHTDPVGTGDYNRGLGQRRADAVRRALLETLDRMRPGSARFVAISVESAGETQPVDRGPSEPQRARNRRVEIFLPGGSPQPAPPPEPSPTTRTETVRIVAKSSILPVGSAIGSVPCGVTIISLVSPILPSAAPLRAFSALLDRVITDHIRNDARDRMYRLFSQQSFRVVCQDGKIVSVMTPPIDTDVGVECVVPRHGCLTPPALVVVPPTVSLRRTAPDTFAFEWLGKGRPHDLAEPAFQAICPRTSRYIWHKISGTIRCGTGGVAVAVNLRGSRFPTHAVFVNGVLRASLAQGTLGMLWTSHASDPSMVR